MTQIPGFQSALPEPPNTGNPALDAWLRQLKSWAVSRPRVSWFSGVTPNSVLTGTAGDLAINLASGSTDTRVWVMGGAPTFVTKTGWVTLRTGPS